LLLYLNSSSVSFLCSSYASLSISRTCYCLVEAASLRPKVSLLAVEGTAQGVLVADASLPYLGIGILKEPIICEIEHGFVTKIEGGVQAKVFEKALKSHNDRNCFNVAELGVGLNPNARLTGVMLEDEGVLGTIHIGLGTNFTLGGKVVAPTHYDLLMWNPTIIVDDTVVQHGQKILI